MQPRCYVIAHTSSRVAGDCVQSLERHGWPYRIWPAVDGQSVTQAHWDHIGVIMSDLGKISRRPGAQGCWLSHFGVWSECVKNNEPVIVLEHDALVMAPWPNDIDLDPQVIKLYTTAECKVNPAYGLWSKGSHAYTLTPQQAQQLIDHARKTSAQAVDKHLGDAVVSWRFYHQDLVVLHPGRGRSSTSRIK